MHLRMALVATFLKGIYHRQQVHMEHYYLESSQHLRVVAYAINYPKTIYSSLIWLAYYYHCCFHICLGQLK